MIEDTILKRYHTVAVVGLSPDPNRPSHKVASYLAQHGYEIIPVNPDAHEILGKPSYPDLQSLPQSVEIVDIFRRSEEVMPIVDEAIKIGARAVWMQEGIVNEEAAARARDAGLLVVMDRCMLKEHRRLSKEPR
jgi:predicted CoA-binding protein